MDYGYGYGSGMGGFFGLLIFILDLVAIFDVIRSSKSIGSKILWILLILILPLVGLIIYALFGRERRALTH